MHRRSWFLPVLVVGLIVVVGALVVGGLAVGALGSISADRGNDSSGSSSSKPADPDPTPTPRPTARPIPGHEVYGYIPYWEMDEGIAQHLASRDLSTIALFSVTVRRDGTVNASARGYKRIVDAVGRRLVREAHDRGVRIEVVFSSFGSARNERLFGGPIETQDLAIEALVDFAEAQRFDGINVDVETLDRALVPAYGHVHLARSYQHPRAGG